MRSPLLARTRLGRLELPNRVVMAPMSRRRAGPHGVPTALMATYYAQRASVGLIITESTALAPAGAGSTGAPGIYTEEQTAGWRAVTDAVHERGGRIFLQLWHAGRATHPAFLPSGTEPVGPSALAPAGDIATPTGRQPYPTPRALVSPEIAGIVGQFADGARRARAAGFDGVEIHAAQGFLIDQFLRDGANRRSDAYGGPIERRARFLLEVTAAVCAAWDADRVGVQLSPTSPLHGMTDSDPAATFGYAAEVLDRFGLAYLHVAEPIVPQQPVAPLTPSLRARFRGPFMVNGGYTYATAEAAISAGAADLVSFGRPLIANPDLVERFVTGAALAQPDPSTFYGGDERGYTDYPTRHASPAAKISE
jgi:N-ethylmaleimide reductase